MQTIRMMPFKKEEVAEILDIVGAKADEKGNVIFDGKIQLCEGCGTAIQKQHLGSVIPGSEHFLCDNPICFYKFYNKLKSKKDG